jgi:hypothetical protein
LTVRPTAHGADDGRAQSLVIRHGWKIERLAQAKTDLELLCQGCKGRFSGLGDCRVFAVFDERETIPRSLQDADVVLSPSGTVGRANQMRLRLDDAAPFLDRLDRSKPVSREHATWQKARAIQNETGPCLLI